MKFAFFRHFLPCLLLALPLSQVRADVPVAANGLTRVTPALWQASKAGSPSKLYLFGTIHLLPRNLDWTHGEIGPHFAGARRVVFELLPDTPESQAQLQQLVLAAGKLEAPRTLADVAGPALYADTKANIGPEVPEAVLQGFRPWLASVLLDVTFIGKQGYAIESGAEKTLQALPEMADKEVIGLESREEQIGFFSQLNEAEQLDLLRQTLDDIHEGPAELKQLLTDWQDGHDEHLADTLNKSLRKYPRLYALLVVNRNQRWLPRLEAFTSKPGDTFVAVGCGHLGGPDGLIALLRARGYVVEKLQPRLAR